MSDVFGAMGSALYSKLAAGTVLTTLLGGTAIYNALAPQGATPPYVIFTTSGSDDNSSPRRARTHLVTIKTVTTDQANAESIDSQIDALIHEATLTITGWGNYWTSRESDIAYEQVAGNVIYWHRGARYKIRIAE